MKAKNLKQEIKSILSAIDKNFGKDSREYQNAEYCFDILETVYRCNYSDGIDLLNELKELLNKLSDKVPELAPERFSQYYPSISEMIKYLEEWLPD
ncbi:hypothetical protein [Calorimonas adulescens]|uniref:Uncharacterized protein n=1 Tax=Calorimonas adulescens TaxID=2606906 RepID=A0A5D8Q927_9THEO|nr:hypothetical protein [Calorimonas adulescens]TZE80684.1 hypothetical protein FWJ32_12485 [Calorimonas adulescens]